MKETMAKTQIWIHYLNVLFVALFMSDIPMPLDKPALLACSSSALAGTFLVHITTIFTGNYRISSYLLLFLDLATVTAAVMFTGMIASPFFVYLPLVVSVAWFVEFKPKAAFRLAAAAIVLLVAVFLVWLFYMPEARIWSPAEYPVFTLVVFLIQLLGVILFLALVIFLPNPLFEELARQEVLLARQKHKAEIGAAFTVITHEIRNPLTAISGNLQLLKASLLRTSSPKKAEWTSRIKAAEENADRIAQMLESILSYARERQGRYFIDTCETKALIERATHFIKMKYADLKFTITRVRGANEAPKVRCDADAIQQVLINLLDNAINARDGRRELQIEIHEEVVEGAARITIHDNGKGIPPAHLPSIFERFATNRRDGSGIGLFISKQIIEDHKGVMSAHSVENLGTAMRFTLPLADGERAPAAGIEASVDG